MQVEYSFYTDTYGGTDISEMGWKRLSQKAVQRLRGYTFDRLPDDWSGQPWENQAKCAVCEMAEIIEKNERRAGKTSENTDGYSVSYETGASLENSLRYVALTYLGNTGLMYLGGV